MAVDDPMMRVRLPAPLKARIEEAARAGGRSMNSEIVQRLEYSFHVEAARAFKAAVDSGELRELIRKMVADEAAQREAAKK